MTTTIITHSALVRGDGIDVDAVGGRVLVRCVNDENTLTIVPDRWWWRVWFWLTTLR